MKTCVLSALQDVATVESRYTQSGLPNALDSQYDQQLKRAVSDGKEVVLRTETSQHQPGSLSTNLLSSVGVPLSPYSVTPVSSHCVHCRLVSECIVPLGIRLSCCVCVC